MGLHTPHMLIGKQKLTFLGGLLVAVFGLAILAGVGFNKVSAADCDNNAIIYCGYTSPSNFINQVRANDSKNGHHDLQAVYAAYGLEPASYDKFVSSSRPGTAYKDGRIVVDGRTVATNSTSIGRQAAAQGPGYFSQNIAGTTYYGNASSTVFASNSIPVDVMFNDQGVMQFAVLRSCGNPMNGNKVTPNYSCDSLNMTPVSGEANAYTFTTSASAGNGATIAKVVYDFGDGTTATETNPSTSVKHVYKQAGSYTVKSTVYVNLPGNQQATVTSGGCQKVIKVVVPQYQCVQLTGAILDKTKFSYSFTATAKYSDATFVGADFNFGDGKTANDVQPTTSTTVTVEHTYDVAGNYSASATLHFMVNGQSQAVSAPPCKAMVTPTTPPTPECKPGVPVGSPECTPCQYDASLPSNSPQCVPPVLPSTGAGNVIAIFGAVAIGGALIYRQLLFRRHRAAFMAAELGTSPLPLGDPMNDETPLENTPLATKRKAFRRRRPF